MRFFLFANCKCRSVTEISAEFLKKQSIKFLMLDLDNTIAAYGQQIADPAITDWSKRLQARGIRLFIVSNNRHDDRVKSFAAQLNCGYIKSAGKPSPKGVKQAMQTEGYNPEESALAGDQVYTDVASANLAGALSIAVRPISLKNPVLALRFALEAPFRPAGKYIGDKL